MSFLHNFSLCPVPRGFIVGLIILCSLCIYAAPVSAQAITEYLTLQSQVQGGTRQGVAKKDPVDAGAQPVSNSDGADIWAALQEFLNGIAAKVTPLQVGIVGILVIFAWFLMR